MSNFVALLGPELVKKNGETFTTVDTSTTLQSKIVGLYFSAHWCPPCRGFTPQLVNAYKSLTANQPFEIVFVSSDKDEDSFKEYYGQMPWLGLPFKERQRKAQLSKKFKVQGIPSLVILDTDGSTITLKGREQIANDPNGANFPWKPKPLSEVLGNTFLKNSSGETIGKEALQNKPFGLYFSAHWCPPCRGFTPKLIETYNNIKSSGKPFEIVFISSDQNQDQFKEYYETMPWLALPYEDRDRKTVLSDLFDVEGIPTFVTIDEKGQVISRNARSHVQADPKGLEFPWFPKPVNDVSNAEDLNEEACLIVFLEKTNPEKVSAIISSLESVAKEHIEKAESQQDTKLLFFSAADVSPVSTQIRHLTQNIEPTETPLMILLDIPDQGGFYVFEGNDINEATIKNFIHSYFDKKIERKQLSR